MKRLPLAWLGASLAALATPAEARGRAAPEPRAGFALLQRSTVPRWSGEHALTIPSRRLELGVLGGAHYGFGRYEVSLHPLLFFALPHLQLKAQLGGWPSRYATALRVRLSYPTLFLGLVSREGAGGLLPKTSEAPSAVITEGDFLITRALGYSFYRAHLLTAALGAAVAAHRSFAPTELPLLDFPFLYPRFAALYTAVVPRFFVGAEGPVWRERLFYSASARYFLMPSLPDVGAASAIEPSVALEYRVGERFAASLALKASVAKYAYGTRLHLLPYADVRVGF